MKQRSIFLIGAGAVAGFAALWHGPLGAGERMAQRAETIARRTLVYYELPMIEARMERGPLARRLVLRGPADPFQRAELVRILDDIPGILEVRWDDSTPAVQPRKS
ncbi:hypothetical protein [Sphingomonas xanthus]|uniref:BON domain-containing protein n=1 Tax=Sphingomonas xanthus TaxID=2594473 RepID=A0A516IS83_9SPHN|nr:hypothetical protein [Sphingomonas xanthus]QDP19741.1 hypothetical protein FMM02_07080 [Sphingomonas xanthus]